MKKLITIAATVLITSGIFYSCSLLKSLEEAEQNGFICNNYENYPVNEMDKQTVLSMVRNYYQNQYRAINYTVRSGSTSDKLVTFPDNINVDSRAVFFNLDTLKRLIYYIEKAARKFTTVQKEYLGVNIFFGSYPKDMEMSKGGYNYTNRHTLVFIPAIFNNDVGKARDFDLNNSLNGTNVLDPLYIDSSFLNNPALTTIPGMTVMKVMGASVTGTSTNMNSQNHGTATPPPPTPTGNAILDKTDPY
jgi:hypothetical protein